MLLRLIKSSNFIGIFLLLLAGFLFWMKTFQFHGNIANADREVTMPLYFIVQTLFNNEFFWQTLAGFIILIINALIITRMSSSFLIFKKGTALPGIIYVITISSVRTLQSLHPVHIATLCILIAISYIFDTYQKRVEIPHTFNASFLIATASLFYLPAVIFLPMIWISIFVLQKSDNWRLLVVPILGFCFPWIFFWVISFMIGSSNNVIPVIKNIIWSKNNDYLFEPGFLARFGIILLLIIFGSISFIADYQSIKISARKYLTIFYWMLGIMILTALFFTTVGNEFIAFMGIPAVIIVSYFFLAGRKYFWKELLLLLYIGVITGSYMLYG